jgi:hypothetical protein
MFRSEIQIGHNLFIGAVHPDDCMIASCGSAACRRIITGKDWRQNDLQQKYRGLFSWYLEQKIELGDLGIEYGNR